MVSIECCGEKIVHIDTDSRQEWTEEEYQCSKCNKSFTRRTEYSQQGLVISDGIDELEELEKEEKNETRRT